MLNAQSQLEEVSPPQSEVMPESEAARALLDLCADRVAPLVPELLVRHVLAITEGADWPLRRAAMEALLRRVKSAQDEELRVASQPAAGRALGSYSTRRGGRLGGPRPYVTQLLSVDLPAGSCECPDFRKSSLGLCKHLLAVLMTIYQRPRRLLQARAEEPSLAADQGPPRLRLEAIRPLLGEGDLLLQIHWLLGAGGGADLRRQRARRWFQPASDAVWVLRQGFSADPQQRLSLVRDLLAMAAAVEDPYRDPALLGLLQDEAAELTRRAADLLLLEDLPRLLASLSRPLYPYQREGVERFLRRGRLLLADDMGLGKTAQAIAACHVLWQSGKVRRGLLCVPASLKPQWQREWRHTSPVPLTLVEGTPAEREAIYAGAEAGFLLVNYEQVLRDLPLVQRFAAELVVLDEAQRIKNWATKTALSIKTLAPTYRLVLTGTPMENRLEELASLMDWVDPVAIEPKWRLQPLHSLPASGEGRGGARHLDTLRQRLSGSMLRRVRREVLAQLPPRTDTRVPVAMTAEQRAAHDELDLPIARLIATLKRRPLTPAEHLRLMSLLTTQRVICNGLGQLRFNEVWPALREAAAPQPALREGLFAPKLEALRELLASLVVGQERKVVIFSQWRRMLRLSHWAVRDILEEAGLRAVFFTGAEAPARRTQNIVEFHDDPAARVMFLTDAGGVGLNLQRAASACVNLELPWNPAVLEQRIGRIYRLGQGLPIDVYNLIAEEGIEGRIAALVGSKRALFTGLFDDTTDEVRYEGASSFLARMEQLVPEALLRQVSGGAEDSEASEPLAQEEALLRDADEARDAQELGEAVHVLPPAGVDAGRGTAAGERPAEARGGAEDGPARATEDGPERATEDGPVRAAPAAPEQATAAGPERATAAGPERATAAGPERATVAGPERAAGVAPPALSAESVRQAFAQVSIQRQAGGGLRIDAPPAAAQTLAALFSGLAQLLGQVEEAGS